MARRGGEVLRTAEATVEHGDKIYTVKYEVFRDGVRLETGQATHLGGMTPEQIARVLLRELIESGFADRHGLGRSKPK
jgi:hypothetical protein